MPQLKGFSQLPHSVVELYRQKYITQRQFLIYIEYLDRFNGTKERAFASVEQLAKEMQISSKGLSKDRLFLRDIGLLEFESETWRTPNVKPNLDPDFEQIVEKVRSYDLGGLGRRTQGGSVVEPNKQEDSNNKIVKQEDNIYDQSFSENLVDGSFVVGSIQEDTEVKSYDLTYTEVIEMNVEPTYKSWDDYVKVARPTQNDARILKPIFDSYNLVDAQALYDKKVPSWHVAKLFPERHKEYLDIYRVNFDKKFDISG